MIRNLRHSISQFLFLLSGRYFKLARQLAAEIPAHWQLVLEEKQPIHATEFSAGKLTNIRRALRHIDGLTMPPDSLFSWWHAVPRPDAANGFALGRTLVNGRLTPDYGGGLCQLSGIIYLVALKLGSRIYERHSHSRDIYHDNERYAPLGADAAVVYGYKNLVFKNTAEQTFFWRVCAENNELLLRIYCSGDFKPATITFEADTKQEPENIAVTTLRQLCGNAATETVCRSFYRRKANHEKI